MNRGEITRGKLPGRKLQGIHRGEITIGEFTCFGLMGRIPRFGRVSGYMRDVLHWLRYPQRIVYRVAALVRRCIEFSTTLSLGTLLPHCCY